MINPKHNLWCEKYRPTKLEDYVFHNKAHKTSFYQMVEDKTIPHLLLSGVQGSGKTTIAQILVNEIVTDESDIRIINASDENSVDDMRDKIKHFISTFPMGEFKVVLLEEADYLSLSAQAVLRKYMEDEASSARFILTCNYDNKIIPAIKSRSQQFRFKAADKNGITEFAAKILISENIEFDLDRLDKYISVGYPDIRKIINLLQQNSLSGSLLNHATEIEAGDYKFKLLDFIGNDNWQDARLLLCANVPAEEWESVYRFLYENIGKSPKFSQQDKYYSAILVIAEFLYKNSICADPEINAAGMLISLSQI